MVSRIEELLKDHQALIEDCNIASLKVKLLLPKDIELNNIEPRVVANFCVSRREDDLVNLLHETQRVYNKYKQYSQFEKKETVISYTLFTRLREANIFCTRVYK